MGFAVDVFGAGKCVYGAEQEKYNRILKTDRDLDQRRMLVLPRWMRVGLQLPGTASGGSSSWTWPGQASLR